MILAILLITIGTSIGAFLVKIGWGYLNTYRLLLRSNCFSGPRAFPFLGSAHLFVGHPADIGARMLDIMNDHLESPFRIWLGMRLYFVVQDPEQLKLVLHNQNALEKDPSVYDLVVPLLGDGLATSPVSLWKSHRKLVEPFFRTTVIESYIALIARNALLTVKKMGMEELGREFVVHDYISRYSFDNICEIEPKKYLASQLLTLAEDGGKLNDKEIIDHIITTIVAGYDSTARMISGAIFILARYPHIQDNVYAEVRETFGESEVTDITLQNVQRMPYTDRLLKEALRFLPALSAIVRRLTKDINLGECTLPAGSSVVLMMMATHRNENYWPRALECHPDRFLPGHPLGPRHPYAFIPFSAGPRNCIGMKYGMISAKILLATLVSRYIIKTRVIEELGDLKLKIDITMRPKEPVMISLERRLPESN